MIKNNVLIGIDNWLFLHNGSQKQFDYLLGKEKVSDESVSNFVSNIEGRIDYFQENNIEYRHIVFPSKPLVKNKFLPKEFQNVSSLYEVYYQKYISDVKPYVLHPLDELKRADEKFSAFHKYNTHNSDLGYIEIIKNLLQSLHLNCDFKQYIKNIVTLEVGGGFNKNARFY